MKASEAFIIDLPVNNSDILNVDISNNVVYLCNNTKIECKRVKLPTTCELHECASDSNEHFTKHCEILYKLVPKSQDTSQDTSQKDGVIIKNYKFHPHYSKFEFEAPTKDECAHIFNIIKKIQKLL